MWLWMPEWENIPWCDTVWYAGKFCIYFNTKMSFKKLKDQDSRLGGVTGRSSVNAMVVIKKKNKWNVEYHILKCL